MSTVYFIDFRTTERENIYQKMERLLETAGISGTFKKRDLVALKLHFGELGNTAFIRPVYIRKIVEIVRKHGGEPFLTDANTLYSGARSHAPSHITCAIQNGFAFSVVNAPIVIADGLRGKSEVIVDINRKRFRSVHIASEIARADALISIAHFKGHELSGFGGALKNIGMGCASRKGKLAQHSTVNPKVIKRQCIGCGDCAAHCSQQAIQIVERKAVLNPETCIGCAECVVVCERKAIRIRWNQTVPVFMENMMEYALGALSGKKDRAFFINFITNVSPKCDCTPHNDAAIVGDLGIMASTDPVAVDMASVDLVNSAQALPGTCLTTHLHPGEDKFKGVYPKVEWRYQLEYAKKIGLGSFEYNLENLS